MNILKLFSTVFVCIVFPGLLFAASTNFTIRTQIGTDTNPPTTPVIIDTVPVATTQINVSWTASVDDVIVLGYRVFRDALQIATTTLLTYSDTGLTPSTTYSYTVDAFDSFGNISSSSLPVATTTLPLVVPPVATISTSTTQAGGTATKVGPRLTQLVVYAQERSAQFTWETTQPTQYTLEWGRTTSYEIGSVSGTIFSKNHTTRIDMLEPGTLYYYKLTAADNRGTIRVISTDSFTTLNKIFTDSIPNVSGFSAMVNGSTVSLAWRNTFTDPSLVVRIVRSHLFYPGTIQSGAVVYEGQAESFIDREALAVRSPQYYTIFVIDKNGKVSSGAIAKAVRVPEKTEGNTVPQPTEPEREVPPEVIDEGDPAILKASDITIIQNNIIFSFSDRGTLEPTLPFVIRIPSKSVAANLKTITVTLQNPSNQREVSAYLLKLNPKGDAYEAVMAAVGVVGSSRILVEVFDYEEQTVRRISTHIEFVSNQLPVPFFPDQISNYGMLILPWTLFFSLFCLLVILFKRRTRNKNVPT